MNPSPSSRWAPISGLLFVTLSLSSWLLFIGAPGVAGTADDTVKFVNGHRSHLLAAGFLAGLAVVPFLCFLGVVFATLRNAGEIELAVVAVAAGVVAASIFLLVAGIPAALAFNIADTAEPRVVKALYDVVWPLQLLITFPSALLVGAFSVAAIRSRLFPEPIGRAGIGCAFVILLGGTTWAKTGKWSPSHGFSYAALFVFLTWMTITCTMLLISPHTPSRARDQE